MNVIKGNTTGENTADNIIEKLSYTPNRRMINADKLASKIAGHSYYHGDRILSAIFCMAEGKEVGNIKPTNIYDKDRDICGRSTFSQRFRLCEEYEKWIEERNKEIQETSNDEVDANSLITAIVFLEEKGYRRVFYD